ncbi:MAG: hypothetical protein AVO35_03725 [Candidatus Aegiribacteria sp. MLS_C]|nr:MAG: hypothetical protein AVO35_03725 [Candidatus Aegiribacteria sp. MLS_C]
MAGRGSLEVFLEGEWPEQSLDLLSSLLDEGVTLTTGSISGNCSVLVCGRPGRELLEAAPGLSHLLIPWAGLPESTRELMMEYPGIAVHNIHHNAAFAAELAVGLMIAAGRLILSSDRALRMGDWSYRYRQQHTMSVNGSRVLLLGYGHVGRAVGRIAKAMGACTKAIRRDPSGEGDQGTLPVHPPEALHELLPDTDFLVVALPLTQRTRGVIGEEELAMMHSRSVLVNVGRGQLVQQGPLYRSLAEGRIGAAGLDVWYRYPSSQQERNSTPPADFDFQLLENVVMTPHIGGGFGSPSLERSRCRHLAASLNSLARHGYMPDRVDLDKGY